MSASDTALRVAEQIALALLPVAVDVLRGATAPEILADAAKAARSIVVQIESEHLLEAHGAVLLADLRALERTGAAILAWLKSHEATSIDSGNPDAPWTGP